MRGPESLVMDSTSDAGRADKLVANLYTVAPSLAPELLNMAPFRNKSPFEAQFQFSSPP